MIDDKLKRKTVKAIEDSLAENGFFIIPDIMSKVRASRRKILYVITNVLPMELKKTNFAFQRRTKIVLYHCYHEITDEIEQKVIEFYGGNYFEYKYQQLQKDYELAMCEIEDAKDLNRQILNTHESVKKENEILKAKNQDYNTTFRNVVKLIYPLLNNKEITKLIDPFSDNDE